MGGGIRLRVGRVYIYGDRGKEIHLRVGRVYILKEGRYT